MSTADDSSDISMSILEIDEVLKDDNFLSASDSLPDEVTNILLQWKLNEKEARAPVYNNCNDSKYIDTRTFTRPKRRSAQNLERTFSNLPNDNMAEQESPISSINLKIGGLVTTGIEESFLNLQTPPMDMESSLITSGDFTNLNFLSSEYANNDRTATLTNDSNYNGYTLSNVISDRKFLEELAGDETFLKDENISKIDFTLADSGSNTLQNSEDFSMKSSVGDVGEGGLVVGGGSGGVLNETFVPTSLENCINETVVYTKPVEEEKVDDVNGTIVIVPNIEAMINGTFEVPAAVNTTYANVKELNATYGNKENGNDSYTVADNNFANNSTEAHTPEDYKNKFMHRRSLENITPIRKVEQTVVVNDIAALESTPMPKSSKIEATKAAVLNNTYNPAQHGHTVVVTQHEEDEEQDVVEERPQIRVNKNLSQILTEQERQSLANFEEFEKSISMLGNGDGNEKEFDDILNSLGNTESKLINEKMRQSLDNIKKRHSIMNLEKQQEDLIKKSTESAAASNMDSNRLSESLNRSMNSSSGSERLLNRRSRMYDGINKEIAEQQQNGLESSTEGRITPNAEEKPEKNNRDRFKTIRIFRKPNDGTLNLPDADGSSEESPTQSTAGDDAQQSAEPQQNVEEFKAPAEPVSRLARPKRFLAQPRFYGQRPPGHFVQTLKSSSADDLLDRNCDGTPEHSDNEQRENVTSPMGTKAKSFHNITTTNATNYNASHSSSSSSNSRKLPTGLARPTASKLNGIPSKFGLSGNRAKEIESQTNLRFPRASSLVRPVTTSKTNTEHLYIKRDELNLKQNTVRKPNAIASKRPPTTAYTTNSQGRASLKPKEIESGRYSPNSLSSSASSRGSTQSDYREQTPRIETTTAQATNPVRPSGLRPPSNLRSPTARSGLPRPTGLPRR